MELCDECLRLAQEYTEAALAACPSIPQKKLKVDAAWQALESHMTIHEPNPNRPVMLLQK
jgi:hypothetical protein